MKIQLSKRSLNNIEKRTHKKVGSFFGINASRRTYSSCISRIEQNIRTFFCVFYQNILTENKCSYIIMIVNKNRRSKEIVNFPRFIIAVSIFACIISFAISMATSQVFSAEPIEYSSIVVAKGDTLWSIASELEGNTKENIYNIQIKNDLNGSIIYEGQELLIPIKK